MGSRTARLSAAAGRGAGNINRLVMTEKAEESGRTQIMIQSLTGDIVLHAPEGKVHIESLLYSKDVGGE